MTVCCNRSETVACCQELSECFAVIKEHDPQPKNKNGNTHAAFYTCGTTGKAVYAGLYSAGTAAVSLWYRHIG